MAQRALITGVPGFAGGHLAEFLLVRGDSVMGSSPSGGWEAMSSGTIQKSVPLVVWDMASGTTPATVEAIERFGPTMIYHLAAVSVPAQCGDSTITRLADQVNAQGTEQVLQLAGQLASRPRVLFISSSHVYARPESSPSTDDAAPEEVRLSEQSPIVPATPYGMTKWKAEEAVRRAVRDGVCEAVIVRAFQHTGPRQQEPLMLPQWIRQFADGGQEPVEVHTKNAWIDFSDVRDVVRAYALLAQHGTSGEAYNVGAGVARRTGDILDTLRDMVDRDRKILETRPGFKHDPIADIRKLTECTGWQATIPVEKTVADSLAYWQQRH